MSLMPKRLYVEPKQEGYYQRVSDTSFNSAVEYIHAQWQPIESAPGDADYVLLWADCWRHPFVGQVSTSGMAWIDVPTPTATKQQVFATHWMPIHTPPPATSEAIEDDAKQSCCGL